MLIGVMKLILKLCSVVLFNSSGGSERTGWDLGSSSVHSNRCLDAGCSRSQLGPTNLRTVSEKAAALCDSAVPSFNRFALA